MNTPKEQPKQKSLPLIAQEAARPINAYVALLIENLTLPIKGLFVRQFLEDVLAEPDLRLILATPIRADGKEVRLLVEFVQTQALAWQDQAVEFTSEVDAVYVATILQAIDYLMFPALCGKYDTPHALRQIVHPHLQQLLKVDVPNAWAIQICMRWNRYDEEGEFNTWLAQRMGFALRVLELASF